MIPRALLPLSEGRVLLFTVAPLVAVPTPPLVVPKNPLNDPLVKGVARARAQVAEAARRLERRLERERKRGEAVERARDP